MKKIRNYLNRNFNRKRSKDSLSKKKRSVLMSKIRSKGTKFEREFIEKLKKVTKKKFQINVSSIKGKPDVVFPKEKIVIFLDSDFWHGWQFPRWKHLLKNNFWRKKIENNRKHDKKISAYLRKKGWIVFRIWEHDLAKNLEKIIIKLKIC